MASEIVEVVSDGLRLRAHITHPDGPRAAAVLLHGIPSSAPPEPDDPGYPGLAATLAERGHAAAWMDLRGARGAPGFFSIEGWVRDAAALAAAVASHPATARAPLAAIGFSAGGAVALEAARRGVAFDAVAVLGTPAQWLSFAAGPADGVRRILAETGMPVSAGVVADPESWAAEFYAVTALDSIAAVAAPVVIVHGDADDVVPVEHAFALAHAAPRARLEIVRGAGHQLRRDDRAVAIVASFLDELAGGRVPSRRASTEAADGGRKGQEQ